MALVEKVFLAFIPLFVAVDALGILPIFSGLTEGMDQTKRNRIITESMITAAILSAGFVFVGKLVFRLLGITMGDFMIAVGQEATHADQRYRRRASEDPAHRRTGCTDNLDGARLTIRPPSHDCSRGGQYPGGWTDVEALLMADGLAG